MLWVGLTGGMGCGKSSVAELLKQKQVPVISADEVSHNVMFGDASVHQQIEQRWGIVFDSEAYLNYRQKIAAQVFGRPEDLEFLEQLLHPKIQAETARLKQNLKMMQHSLAVYDVPLLFEKNLQAQFDFVVGVFAPKEVQFQRLRLRNAWSDEEIQRRIDAQMPNASKAALCDFVIQNDGAWEHLQAQVQVLYEKLRQII